MLGHGNERSWTQGKEFGKRLLCVMLETLCF